MVSPTRSSPHVGGGAGQARRIAGWFAGPPGSVAGLDLRRRGPGPGELGAGGPAVLEPDLPAPSNSSSWEPREAW